MRLHLTLGLRQKTQIPFIPQQPGQRADSQRAAIPQRIEQAQMPAQIMHPPRSPGQMLGLLLRRLPQFFLDYRVARGQRLPLIQSLGANLAAVVDPHQRRRVFLLALIQPRLG